jgi:hypothetical protein
LIAERGESITSGGFEQLWFYQRLLYFETVMETTLGESREI